jgi:large subunit ribosomal protein LP2
LKGHPSKATLLTNFQLISEGGAKLASVPSGGGGGGGAATGGAAAGGAAPAEEKAEEKEEGKITRSQRNSMENYLLTHATEKEESDEDMGFGLFD